MLFDFLKYLQPTHYFQRFRNNGKSVFPNIKDLPHDLLLRFESDKRYKSEQAQSYDISWRIVQAGYIGETQTYTCFDELPIYDNYVFLRKNFHSAWVFYVLMFRQFSFNNPIVEFLNWYRTRHVTRDNNYDETPYLDWENYNSSLVKENPEVSVIIPTLNRYHFLSDVLKDLEQQDYSNFEVIVVDQSDPYTPEFYSEFNLKINLIRQEEKALWLARNTAIKNSKGEFIALSEDDVRIQPDWVSSHLKCLDFFDAQVSAGVFYPSGKEIPKDRSFFAVASQFATGNAMLKKAVFKTVGLFDRQFEKQRMGDGEFGMRLYLADITSVSNPFASCVDVKAGTGGLREMGSWDAFRPSNFFSPRPIPSVLYYFRSYFGITAAKRALLRTIPLSIFPYQFKKHKPLLILAALLTILLIPIVIYQVLKSWSLASKKIKEGPLIEFFE